MYKLFGLSSPSIPRLPPSRRGTSQPSLLGLQMVPQQLSVGLLLPGLLLPPNLWRGAEEEVQVVEELHR